MLPDAKMTRRSKRTKQTQESSTSSDMKLYARMLAPNDSQNHHFLCMSRLYTRIRFGEVPYPNYFLLSVLRCLRFCSLVPKVALSAAI